MEYEVLWGDGPLGLTLRPDLGEDMPPVVGRITRYDSAAALAKVAIGDMLVSINGIETARQGYDHVVDLLQKIPRPATLRFRVPRAVQPLPRVPSAPKMTRGSTASISSARSDGSGTPQPPQRRHEQYTVVWTEGPLGMILRPDDDDVHVPCIRKITGKGAGTGMERATVGDVLVAVNGQETKSLGFRSTISLLKSIRKPAVLKFKRMHRRVPRRRTSREDASINGSINGSISGSISGDLKMQPSLAPTPVRPSLPTNGSGSGSALIRSAMYDIVWREGDLGLKLKPGHRDVPVLSKLTGKGTASGLQNANVGDELVSVNGVLVEGQPYHDTLRMLKHSVKPAVLRFRPGRDRTRSRDTVVSDTSIHSSHSTPGTSHELERARSVHTPIYDQRGRGAPPPSHDNRYYGRSTSQQSSSSAVGGERVKKKKRIPLDLAQQVVAASQGVELDQAFFASLPILSIREGTEEAHLLRVEAKMCMMANKHPRVEHRMEKPRVDKMEALEKEELIRIAREKEQRLREALEEMKNQAKLYEEALKEQKREQLLASAVGNKTEKVIAKHNALFAELSGVIADRKRDSYSDLDVVPMNFEDPEHDELLKDLNTIMNTPVVVPSTKYCNDCGATEKESKLDPDDDGLYYCEDCWESYRGAPDAGSVPYEQPTEDEEEEEEQIAIPAPPKVQRVALVGMVAADPATPPRPVLTKGDSASSSISITRMSSVEREQEEKNARMEAEKSIEEIEKLRRNGSMSKMVRQPSNLSAGDRTRHGLDELSQALLEEEERARAEGKLTLAKKLSAQRARTLAQAKAEQQKLNGGPASSTRDPDAEFSRYYKHENGTSSSFDSSSSALSKASSAEFNLPPPATLTRSVTHDSVVTKRPAPATPPPAPAASRNDYEDVNSDEEAEDQVDMTDADDDDVLREMEESNLALAQQLNNAHNVIGRARDSIMMTGEGLSEEQIDLFKKLTTQADERMSMVDMFHPAYDDDDEDSDSDESVMEGVEEGDEDEDEDDDSGVWI